MDQDPARERLRSTRYPRAARAAFKTHCDHIFGGQVWLDVLNQMGGCPAEFVDAWNAVINQRFQVVF